MTFDEAKAAAKSRLGEYLERLGVDLARAMSGSNTKCPICGHSAFHYYPDNRKGESWTCFSGCGSGDIFDLYAAKNGISAKDAFSTVLEMLGLRAGDGKRAPSPSGSTTSRRAKISPSAVSRAKGDGVKRWGAAYLRCCAERIFDDRAVREYLAARGFEADDAAIYGIGYDPVWRHPKAPSSVATTPRLIIPCGDGVYIARDIRDEIPDAEKDFSKPFVKASEGAKIRPFGAAEFIDQDARPDSPLFVTEGWADALSVIQAGAMAIALNSVAFVASFVRDNAEIFRAKGFMLVLCLDNDSSGREGQAKLATLLKAERVAFIERDIVGGFKDANEALVKDGEAFRARVTAIRNECIKQMAQNQETGMNNQSDEQKRREEAAREFQTLYPEVEAMRRKVEDGELMDDSPDAGLQDELDARMTKNESLSSCKEWLDDFLKEMKRQKPLFPSGFPKLDKAISGWSSVGLPVGLYVVGAISSLGKTTFLLQIADQMAEAGRDVLIFSLEMSRFELMGKSISRQSFLLLDASERFRILDALRDGKEVANQAFTMNTFRDFARLQEKGLVSTDAEGSIIAAASKYCNDAGQRVTIVEGGDSGVSMADIRDKVKQYRDTHEGRVPVVIIDYLQMLKPPMDDGGRVLTDKMATDANILACKVLSRNYDTPVFVISSFSRGAYYANKGLAAFKESGAIEYTADVVLTLQYTAIDDAVKNKGEKDKESAAVEEERKIKAKPVRKVEVKILKNRSGAMADAPTYDFVPRFNTFVEQ